MQPIVKWQYEKLEGSLGLLEDHLADPDCPCKSAGENCARKHLKRTEDYCQETMIILARDKSSPQKEFDQLLKLTEEAKEYRRAEERLLCGDKNVKQSELCPMSWASGWRKYFETLLVGTCNLKTTKAHDPVLESMSLSPRERGLKLESILKDINYTASIPKTMVINAGLDGIIPVEYRDFKVELDLVRSPGWNPDNAPQVNSFQNVQKICRLMRKNDREWLLVILLDTRLQLIGLFEASIGGPDQTMVAPLEIARIAIKSGATNLILAHNHPSGHPEPSAADRQVFSNLKNILKPLSLGVLEMAVIGHKQDYSMSSDSYRSATEIYPDKPTVSTSPRPRILSPWPAQGRLMDPQIKIAGKCGAKGKSCSIKVTAVDKIEASTGSINEISKLINQVSERAEKAKKSHMPASPRTWAVGTVTTTKYEFEYRIVEGLKLKVSHDPFSFTPIPGYPQELQPRNRDRAATQLQVKRIAANLDPDSLLTDYHGIDRGTPIIGQDMVVESGNGRTMALILAAKEYPEIFARYRKALITKAPEYGLKFEQKEQAYDVPVMVRVRLSQVDRRQFVEEANASTIIETSAIEKATSDALKLTPEMISGLEMLEGENIEEALKAQRNSNFVRSFVSKLPANEQARLVDAKGILNQEGQRQISMVERELDAFQERILVILDENARSAKKIATILRAYADMVIESAPPSQGGLIPGMDRLSKPQLFETALKRAFLEDIDLLALSDPKWLSKKLEVCNLQPEQISRVMSWKPLRDFLAWGTAAGQVRICESGMGVDAYQVTIQKIEDPTLVIELFRRALQVPGIKQVKTPDQQEAIFEIILPAPERQQLTWNPQEILRPSPRPQGTQPALFDAIDILHSLKRSATDEIKAVENYTKRMKIAAAEGDGRTADLYQQIIDDELQHLNEFQSRLSELNGNPANSARVIDRIVQEVRQALPGAATVRDNIEIQGAR